MRTFGTCLQTLAFAIELFAELTLVFAVLEIGIEALVARHCQALQIALFLKSKAKKERF